MLVTVSANAQDGAQAYDNTVDTVAVVTGIDKEWNGKGGSAVVINRQGYLLTAFHVVKGSVLVSVKFPARNKDGQVIGDAKHYADNHDKLTVPCLIVAIDEKHDLAILKPLKLRADAKAVVFAERAVPGQALFAIGSGNETCFRYAGGAVKQVYQGSYTTDAGTTEGLLIDSTTCFTRGDSGGPLLNMDGELVGINLATEENGTRKSIAVSEAKAFIATTLINPVAEAAK